MSDHWKRLDDLTKLDEPFGWIQWKGTQVCIDLRCVCGDIGHVDGDFFYHYQCRGCGRKFHVGCYVKLVEALPEETEGVEFDTGTVARDKP